MPELYLFKLSCLHVECGEWAWRNLCWKPEALFGSNHHSGLSPSRICYVRYGLFLPNYFNLTIVYLFACWCLCHSSSLSACVRLFVGVAHLLPDYLNISLLPCIFKKIYHETLQWIFCWFRSFVRLNRRACVTCFLERKQKPHFRGVDLRTKPHVLQNRRFLKITSLLLYIHKKLYTRKY